MSIKRHELTDEQWEKIKQFLPQQKRGRPGGDVRVFINAVLWIAKTGSPWRDLPTRFGNWSLIYQRFSYWCDKNHFTDIFKQLQSPDLEQIMIDSTIVKTHQSACGAQKKTVLNLLEKLSAA